MDRLGPEAPPVLEMLGDTGLLERVQLGLVCSIQCPGSVILKTFDAVRQLRDNGTVLAGGFQSPLEKECLRILLRGSQAVVLCPAKGLARPGLGVTEKKALSEGRLLVVSMFGRQKRRTTAAQAIQRNHLVAAMAERLFVPHAAPGGKTWEIVHAALRRNQPVLTLEDNANQALLSLGAEPLGL